MPMYQDQAIKSEIMEKMNLKNRYAFLNNNLTAVLSPEQFNFLRKVERFCMKYEKKNNIQHSVEEDLYSWIPDFGAEGYVSRFHKMEELDLNYEEWGATTEMMRVFAVDQFDPQYNMAMGATVLAINPIKAHHEGRESCLNALRDITTGKECGAILITEPERGSDAVHQLTTCEPQEDGSFILNGEKIFNTNAPKARWVVAYATAEQNVGNKMAQFLIDTKSEGWESNRVYIPWVPKIWIGHQYFRNLRVPAEYVLGGIGKGREHLFEGLIPERIGIAVGNAAQAWTALAHAFIYINMRKQFNQEVLKFQGVGFTFTDLWARTTNFTLGLLKFNEEYDKKIEKFGGEIPRNISQAMVASASHFKLEGSRLSERCCYEMANLMGGAGVCDNTLMWDLLGISRIQEIVGGTRQIQQYILSMATRQLWKMI
jgi:alkylation response protein AidB-like acyl-CoA dehydrogenase